MANMAAPLRHWPKAATVSSRHFLCSCSYGGAPGVVSTFSSTSSSSPSPSILNVDDTRFSNLSPHSPSYALSRQRWRFSSSTLSFPREVESRGKSFRLAGRSPYADAAFLDEDSDYGPEQDSPRKSRNQQKREARRAVAWGMDLAKFSPAQIKRILRAASLEKEVFDAIMLVKRLGPDVREGRRRQFGYIGKLLRNAQPELMDELIRATKDGDSSKIQSLSGPEVPFLEGELDEEEDTEDDDDDDDDDGNEGLVQTAGRWFDGLINKDSSVINEVYSINNADFDRQELRRLVRRVQSVQGRRAGEEEGGEEADDPELTKAKSSLSRFLRRLAKQSEPTDHVLTSS